MNKAAPFFLDRNHAGKWCCCDEFGLKDAYPDRDAAEAEVAKRNHEAQTMPEALTGA